MPGNIMFAGVFGTAFTIICGLDPIIAPVVAIPMSLLGNLFWRLQMTINSRWVNLAEKYADSGKIKSIELTAYLYPQIAIFLIYLVPSSLLIYQAATLKDIFMDVPVIITDALAVAGGLFPVIGIAMILNYLFKLKVFPYFLIGYFAVCLLNLHMAVIALFGFFIAVIQVLNRYDGNPWLTQKSDDNCGVITNKPNRINLIKHWLRCYSQEACYNYKSLQAVGACAAIIPVIRDLYKNNEQKMGDVLKNYLVFFNTEPGFIGPSIAGVAASMEVEKVNGLLADNTDIQTIRTGLMGPLAGMGDYLVNATIYPLLIAVSISLAIDGYTAGPLLFLIIFGSLMLYTGYRTYMMGYCYGKNAITSILKSDLLKLINETMLPVSILSLGALSASVLHITINWGLFQGEINLGIARVISALAPLLVLMVTWFIVKKKLPLYMVIAAVIILALLASGLGILVPAV